MDWYKQSESHLQNRFFSRGSRPHRPHRNLEEFGPNELKEEEKRSFWAKLIDQFKDVLILILIGAAAVSTMVNEITDALSFWPSSY